MHGRSAEIVKAARACVGTRTRVQGRRPGLALDCIGVVAVAAEAAGLTLDIAADYELRADNCARLRRGLLASGCRPVGGAAAAPGDIAEVEVARGQRHLAVMCGDTAVHAHFGVGRVVEAQLPANWAVISYWRIPEAD